MCRRKMWNIVIIEVFEYTIYFNVTGEQNYYEPYKIKANKTFHYII